MYHNQFDEILNKTPVESGVYWSEETKIFVLLGFLQERGINPEEFREYVYKVAEEEVSDI